MSSFLTVFEFRNNSEADPVTRKTISDKFIEFFEKIDFRGRDLFKFVFIDSYSEIHKEYKDKEELKNLCKDFFSSPSFLDGKPPFFMGIIGSSISAYDFYSKNTSTGVIRAGFGQCIIYDGLNDLYKTDKKTRLFTDVNFRMESVSGNFCFSAYNRREEMLIYGTNYMELYSRQDDHCMFVTNVYQEDFSKVDIYTINRITSTGQSFKVSGQQLLFADRVMCVLSGGLDSTIALTLCKRLGYNVHAVHFSYGQHSQEVEVECSKKLCQHFNVPLIVCDVDSVFKKFGSSVITDLDFVVDRATDLDTMVSYVPARNTIFASIACGLSEKAGCSKIVYGATMDDSFTDSSQGFFLNLNKLFKYSSDAFKTITVLTPFINLTKKEILHIGYSIGAPIDLSISCYNPQKIDGVWYQCGNCASDALREYSHKLLGIVDPVPYLTKPFSEYYKSVKEVYPDWESLRNSPLSLINRQSIPFYKYLSL